MSVAFTASVAELKAIFKFDTDSTDLADAADDITGACVASAWDNLSFDLGASTVASAQAVDSTVDTNVKSDYVRHFSKEILGTSRADLFGNEATLVTTTATDLGDTLNTAIKTSITNNNNSIVRDLYRTIVNNAAQLHRITDLANSGTIQNDGTTRYDVPFEAGDTLVFKVTTTHEPVIIANTQISGQIVSDKEYLVTITVT